MKQFNIGTKVEVLYSNGDEPATWQPATVVNVVNVQPGFERHGHNNGNVVKLDNSPKGKGFITVTEPGFIRNRDCPNKS